MNRRMLAVMVVTALATLSACAPTRVRVRCDQHLQPINPIASAASSPSRVKPSGVKAP